MTRVYSKVDALAAKKQRLARIKQGNDGMAGPQELKVEQLKREIAQLDSTVTSMAKRRDKMREDWEEKELRPAAFHVTQLESTLKDMVRDNPPSCSNAELITFCSLSRRCSEINLIPRRQGATPFSCSLLGFLRS